MTIVDKYAPVKKLTARTVRVLWTDDELKKCMVQRNDAKVMANKSGCTADWLTYYTLRNVVTRAVAVMPFCQPVIVKQITAGLTVN